MKPKPGVESGQSDLFGGAPKPPSKARAVRRPRTEPAGTAAPDVANPVESDPVGAAARLSPAELDDLAARLPDDALARLAASAVRQLRRRLARSRRGSKPQPACPLERAARQIAAELGGEDQYDP